MIRTEHIGIAVKDLLPYHYLKNYWHLHVIKRNGRIRACRQHSFKKGTPRSNYLKASPPMEDRKVYRKKKARVCTTLHLKSEDIEVEMKRMAEEGFSVEPDTKKEQTINWFAFCIQKQQMAF